MAAILCTHRAQVSPDRFAPVSLCAFCKRSQIAPTGLTVYGFTRHALKQLCTVIQKENVLRHPIFVIARLEFLNPGGSVKDRPAKYIVEKGLETGTIRLKSHLIESTSGNLGMALAMVCRVYGLLFWAPRSIW